MFIYAGQGGRGYIGGSLTWIGLYDFQVRPSVTTAAAATGRLPWNFKFVIGLISDNLPLYGYNVKIWMIIAAIFGLAGQVMFAFPALSPNMTLLTVSYAIIEYYGAVADCLSDALVVKNGRNDEEDSSSGLQSLSWFSLGIGGAIFTLIGSQMSTDTSKPGGVSVSGARDFNKIMVIFPIGLIILMIFLKEKKTPFFPGLKTFMQQLVRLFVALFSPPFLVLRTMTWVVLSNASMLDLSGGTSLFVTSELKITPATQGYITVTSYAFLAIGVVIYYRFFRYTSFRRIFLGSQILLALIYCTDYILIKRWNVSIGISDVWFLFAGAAFTDIAQRLNAMPFLVMAGQLCPENMEATFFAMLMSLSNQGGTFSSYLGATVLEHFKVAEGQYEGLPNAVLVRLATMLGVIVLIFLVPDTSALNPANVDSLRPTNPFIIKILKFADLYHPEKFETEESIQAKDSKV
jgi:MFS family permease